MCSKIHVKPIETVEDEKRCWECDATAPVNPLCDFLWCHCKKTSAPAASLIVVIQCRYTDTKIFNRLWVGTNSMVQISDGK